MSAALELDQVDDLLAAFGGGLEPPPLLTVDEWADRHRMLDTRNAAEPGPYRTDRTSYWREVMQRLSPSDPCERVVVIKAAQIGFTEVGNNWVGYTIHCNPGPMLVVQGTVELAQDWSKGRLSPMLQTTPELRQRVLPARSRDSSNTILSKEFPGGVLYVAGANSPVGLRSKPIRYLFLDEVDSYPVSAGREGDPVKLAERRTTTFSNRKVLQGSTPTIEGESRIEEAYLETDRRRYFVPCPDCGHYQTLEFENIRWEEDPSAAEYMCEGCGVLLAEHEKLGMLAAGEWRATAEPKTPGTHGYHLSAFYSPWMTWGECAAQFVEAKRSRNPELLKTWVNTVAGETWNISDGSGVDQHELMGLREDYGPEVPADVVLLTAGVDVQDDRLEVLVRGWARDFEAWAIRHVVIDGDPSAPDVWRELEDLLRGKWPRRPTGHLEIQAVCIDSGGHHTQTVYDFCKKRHGRRWWAINGVGGQGRKLWPKRPSYSNKQGCPLYSIGVDTAKERVYAWLRRTVELHHEGTFSGPGTQHFSFDFDEEFFEQLTVEERRPKYNKQTGQRSWYWWKPDHARNEALDLTVYAYAALAGWLALGRTIEREIDRLADAPSTSTKRDPGRERRGHLGRRRGFLKRRT